MPAALTATVIRSPGVKIDYSGMEYHKSGNPIFTEVVK